jgi:8-oxo-dGTP pyrophosphatase MutT (NUDIX family)
VSRLRAPRRQYAALPWRRRYSVEILLVSSRQTRRWIVPKGWPIDGLSPAATAAREAFEEAGVLGEAAVPALGHFHYLKRHGDGSQTPCRVDVFALEVESLAADWPERDERTRRWFRAAAAANAVEELELKALIRRFSWTASAINRKRSRRW